MTHLSRPALWRDCAAVCILAAASAAAFTSAAAAGMRGGGPAARGGGPAVRGHQGQPVTTPFTALRVGSPNALGRLGPPRSAGRPVRRRSYDLSGPGFVVAPDDSDAFEGAPAPLEGAPPVQAGDAYETAAPARVSCVHPRIIEVTPARATHRALPIVVYGSPPPCARFDAADR